MLFILFILISAILLFKAIKNSNAKFIKILTIFWWLASVSSACFIAYAWSQGANTENWAMYGVFFESIPIIILTAIFAIITIILIRKKKAENAERQCKPLYLLLIFLLTQAGFIAFWARQSNLHSHHKCSVMSCPPQAYEIRLNVKLFLEFHFPVIHHRQFPPVELLSQNIIKRIFFESNQLCNMIGPRNFD